MSNVTQTAANTATGTTIASGVASAGFSYSQWATENLIVISISCTIASLLLALVFNIINSRINYQRMKDAKPKTSNEDIQKIIEEALKKAKE